MMERTIYIAGGSRELERAKRAIAWVREDGWHVTHDWTVSIEAARAQNLTDADLIREERRKHAIDDTIAVMRADAFWFLVPDKSVYTNGSFSELGIASAMLLLRVGRERVPQEGTPRIFSSRSRTGQDSIWMEFGELVECDTELSADLAVRDMLRELSKPIVMPSFVYEVTYSGVRLDGFKTKPPGVCSLAECNERAGRFGYCTEHVKQLNG